MTFEACARTAPPAGATQLKPGRITDAMSHGVLGELKDVPSGTVTLEYAGILRLPRGVIGAAGSYDAVTARGLVYTVADSPVDAPVTLSVLNSPSSGRRVGFLEVRLADVPAVRWADIPDLGIGTDGGDGGFFVGGALTPDADDETVLDNYNEAFSPGNSSDAGNVCVLRRSGTPSTVDDVLFAIGYGDGGYPTVGGYAANGRLVSLVSYGFVIPWRLSGLPGTPPQEVIDQERKLAARS